MRAARVRDAARSGVVELEPLPLGPDDVRVAVAYAGICGTELHPIRDGEPYIGDDGEGSVLFGHEYSGTVIEAGAEVDAVAVGQQVACMPRIACLRCAACRDGRAYACEDFADPPRWGLPPRGAWADQIVVPQRVALPLPADVSLREAALCEPAACALRGVDQAAAPAGHAALVIGGGPIGLLTAALALAAGARSVHVSEPHAARRAIAERLGATPVDPRERPLAEVAREATGGRGFDVVYEAVGHGETVREAIELAARGGAVVVLGVAPEDAVSAMRPRRVFERELRVVGAHGPERTFARMLAWLPALDLSPLVSDVLPLEQVGRAIELSLAGAAGKVLLAPNGAA